MPRPKKTDALTNAEKQKAYRERQKQKMNLLESGDTAQRYVSTRDKFLDSVCDRIFPRDPDNEYQNQLAQQYLGMLDLDKVVSVSLGVKSYKPFKKT